MQSRIDTTNTNFAGVVSAHLRSARLSDMPQSVIDRAKERLLDSVGNILAGVDATGNAAARSVFLKTGDTPEATVCGVQGRTSAPHAALLNSLAMRSYDFEAVGAESADASMIAAHISGTTVPVALATGERAAASGAQVLEALILGDDLASRLAVASGFHTASGGDNTGTVNVMGGAAIAGKIAGFSEVQYRWALGHALNQMAGTVQSLFDKADSFKLPQALGARNAVVAADLAQAGFTGLKDAIHAPFGFFKMFSPNPAPEKLLEALGETFYGDMIIKPWSSCRAAHPALDAVLRVREANHLTAGEIESIEVHVTPTTKRGFTAQDFSQTPASETDGIFSIPFNVAVGMIEGTVRPEHLSVDYMRSDAVRAMLNRVSIVDTLPAGEYQTAEVIVTTKSGDRLHQRVDNILGDIYRNRLSADALLEKYYMNIEFGGQKSREQAEEIRDVIGRIDELDSISDLTRLLA
ncbi:MmgE/PrpD family protein [Leucobacter sp. W1038]|uniref:MmgE/PrpD family protein n=1 Tax=Leucobacter sp. W1038 TaxID=3438281 RepID=UPI003D9623A6